MRALPAEIVDRSFLPGYLAARAYRTKEQKRGTKQARGSGGSHMPNVTVTSPVWEPNAGNGLDLMYGTISTSHSFKRIMATGRSEAQVEGG